MVMTMVHSMVGVFNITGACDSGDTSFIVFGPARNAEFNFLATGNWLKITNDTLISIYELSSNRGPIVDPYMAPNGPSAGDKSVFVKRCWRKCW